MKANNILATIGNTPHIRINRLFGDAAVWIKSERSNPGRVDQGPHRAVDDRGRRKARPSQARRHHRRADLGQHRHRPGDGGRRQGLQAGAGDARQHEHRAPPPDAGLRRQLRADAARKGHEGLDRARRGDRRRHARRLDAAAVREPGQHRGARAHHRQGNPGRFPRGPGRADHRRRHRWPHHRLRAGAEGELAEPEGLCGGAGRLAGDQRRRSRRRTRSRASAPASSRRTCTPPCSTA